MTEPHPLATSIPIDTAFRNWKGATRDHATAAERLQGAKNAWLTTLFEAFHDNFARARDAGDDISSNQVLFTLGLPCIDCHTPARPKTGHRVNRDDSGKKSRWPIWATCGAAPINPVTAPMPEVTPR